MIDAANSDGLQTYAKYILTVCLTTTRNYDLFSVKGDMLLSDFEKITLQTLLRSHGRCALMLMLIATWAPTPSITRTGGPMLAMALAAPQLEPTPL